jgi:hypothetical protein
MSVRPSEHALSHPDLAARLDRLIAGQKHLDTLFERVVTRSSQPPPAWFTADIVERLERIEAELKSWAPVLAVLHVRLLGKPVNGEPVQPGDVGQARWIPAADEKG